MSSPSNAKITRSSPSETVCRARPRSAGSKGGPAAISSRACSCVPSRSLRVTISLSTGAIIRVSLWCSAERDRADTRVHDVGLNRAACLEGLGIPQLGSRRESFGRDHQEGQREPDSPSQRVAGLQRLPPVRAREWRTDLNQPVRDLEQPRRVEPHCGEAGPGRGPAARVAEPAEDHLRQADGAQAARVGRRLTASKRTWRRPPSWPSPFWPARSRNASDDRRGALLPPHGGKIGAS